MHLCLQFLIHLWENTSCMQLCHHLNRQMFLHYKVLGGFSLLVHELNTFCTGFLFKLSKKDKYTYKLCSYCLHISACVGKYWACLTEPVRVVRTGGSPRRSFVAYLPLPVDISLSLRFLIHQPNWTLCSTLKTKVFLPWGLPWLACVGSQGFRRSPPSGHQEIWNFVSNRIINSTILYWLLTHHAWFF